MGAQQTDCAREVAARGPREGPRYAGRRMGGEDLTDRQGKSEQWADEWGAMVPGVWEGEGSLAAKCTDKLPVPAALGAGRYRAGPDPAGSR